MYQGKTLHKNYATRLEECMVAKKLSNVKLSKLIGGVYSGSYICRIKKGKQSMARSFAETVAPFLDTTPEYLRYETDFKNDVEKTSNVGFQTDLFSKASGFLMACGFTLVKNEPEVDQHCIKAVSLIGSRIRESYYTVSDKDLIEAVDRIMGLVGVEMGWLLRNKARRSTTDEVEQVKAIIEENEKKKIDEILKEENERIGRMALEELVRTVSNKERNSRKE